MRENTISSDSVIIRFDRVALVGGAVAGLNEAGPAGAADPSHKCPKSSGQCGALTLPFVTLINALVSAGDGGKAWTNARFGKWLAGEEPCQDPGTAIQLGAQLWLVRREWKGPFD